MRWAITDPRGVTAALQDPSPGPEALRGRLPENFIARLTAPVPSAQEFLVPLPRLDVYAEGYFGRLVETSQSDFVTTVALLGEERYRDLLSEFLCVYPSRSYSITDLGGGLARFVAESRWKETEGLLDCVRLDWAVIESFFADDAAPSDLGAFFAGLAPEDHGRVTLSLHPTVRLLETAGPTYHLIFRGLKNQLPEGPYRVLRAMGNGVPLGKLTPEELNLDNEQISQCFSEFFPPWAAKGIVGNPRTAV